MLEKLKSSPLAEVACEFRFKPTENWDWTIPGRLYDKVQGKYPERGVVQTLGIKITNIPGEPPITTNPSGVDRVQIKAKDGSIMIQVGPNMLSVNQVSGYNTWNDFLTNILWVLTEYYELNTGASFEKIGLRYINKIQILESKTNIGDYITIDPVMPEEIKRPFRNFYQRYELLHEELRGVLIHQTGLIFEPNGSKSFIMLDLDFVCEKPDITKESVGTFLSTVHQEIELAFIHSIEPALLNQMKGIS